VTTRDELADLIYRTLNPEIQQDEGWASIGWLPTVDGTGNVVSHIAADAILARWRLVPVEEAKKIDRKLKERQKLLDDTRSYRMAMQHRAAGELTQHDQDAGIYGDTCQCGEGAEHSPRTHP